MVGRAAGDGRLGIRAALNRSNVDREDGGGWTPLHWAVMESQVAATRLLLEWGASVRSKDEVRASAVACFVRGRQRLPAQRATFLTPPTRRSEAGHRCTLRREMATWTSPRSCWLVALAKPRPTGCVLAHSTSASTLRRTPGTQRGETPFDRAKNDAMRELLGPPPSASAAAAPAIPPPPALPFTAHATAFNASAFPDVYPSAPPYPVYVPDFQPPSTSQEAVSSFPSPVTAAAPFLVPPPFAQHVSPENDDGDESLCIICLSTPKSAGLLHGSSVHVVACDACAPLLAGLPCPVCRLPVERIIPMRQIYT